MQENNKVYSKSLYGPSMNRLQDVDAITGFTISLVEWEPTIPTLWSTVKGEKVMFPVIAVIPKSKIEFTKRHPEYLDPNNALKFVSDNDGAGYNLCHCGS